MKKYKIITLFGTRPEIIRLSSIIKDFDKNNKNLKKKSNLAKKHLYRFDHNINSRKYFEVINKLINEQ